MNGMQQPKPIIARNCEIHTKNRFFFQLIVSGTAIVFMPVISFLLFMNSGIQKYMQRN